MLHMGYLSENYFTLVHSYFDKIGIISVSLFKRLNKRGKESMNAKQRVGFGFLGARVACCSLTACPTFLRGLPNFFMYVHCPMLRNLNQ